MNLNTKGIQSEETKEWIVKHSLICERPETIFVYSPKRPSFFAEKGEQMVESLVKVGEPVFKDFNKLVNLNYQIELATAVFNNLKGSKYDKPGKKGNPGYFKTQRKFSSLIPESYKRTPLAPRLTVKGNTFHAMNKGLLIEIVKEITKNNKDLFIIELDMSACHSRVASSLLPPSSELKRALENESFWEKQVEKYIKDYEKQEIKMTFKILKKMLKVFLYTSLNGGNPASEERLIDNLTGNAIDIIPKKGLTKSNLFYVTKHIAQNLPLVIEVKDLNKNCYFEVRDKGYTFTIDRVEPYVNSATYKGISRVLQGFEVVLLSILTLLIMRKGAIPISLDHDGLMCLFYDTSNISHDMFVRNIEKELSNEIDQWSHYLLNTNLPIEAKRYWSKGDVYEP